MATTEEFELFKGKTLSSLFEDIYKNSLETKAELKELIKAVANMIDDQASASALVPIIKEYLDINIKNDEHLIKLAMIVQRLIASESRGVSESEYGLSDAEKNILIENAESALKEVRDETERSRKLANSTTPKAKAEEMSYVLEKD